VTWSVILKPVVNRLQSQLEESDPHLLDLQSIITALEHLPSLDETDHEKCKERNREKEIIKKSS
jgi:(1->4)-alpha-D-glucan 1-alpha-D-glucosylmutase